MSQTHSLFPFHPSLNMATSLYALSNQNVGFLLLLLLHCPLSITSISFKLYNSMPNIGNYILVRKGIVHSPQHIPLDNDPNSNLFAVFQAIYKQPLQIWDSTTSQPTSFSTHFTFQFDFHHATSYGGGFAFFLAPIGWPIPPNSGSNFLGLYKSNTQSPPIVHIEFQVGLSNDAYSPYQHVGININSLSSSNSTPWDATLHSEDFADVWISYDSKTKDLSVSWEYQKTGSSLENNFLSYNVDLSDALPRRVMFGFTSTTGVYSLSPYISFWEFDTSLSIQKTSKKISNNGRKKVNGIVVPAVVVSSVIGGVFVISGLFVFGRWMMKKARKPKSIENEGGDAIPVGTTS